MTGERREYPAAVSLEAVAAAWARQEHAAAGSVVSITHEIAGRRRGGMAWESRRGAGIRVAVVARPALRPEHEPLCWPAAVTAAALAVSDPSGAGKRVRSWWPDALIGPTDEECGVVNIVAIAEPGRIGAVVVTARWDLDERRIDIGRFTDETLRLLDLAAADPHALLAEHAAHSAIIERRVRAILMPRGEIRGVAAEVARNGELVLRSPSGLAQRVAVAQLSHLEPI